MQKKPVIGINGFGRIGRALFRINLERELFDVAVINDLDPDVDNLAYLLKYDSTYGKLRHNKIDVDDGRLLVDGKAHAMFAEADIASVPWEEYGVDLVIDASGVYQNVLSSRKLVEASSVSKVVVTHAPSTGLDMTLMVGVNEADYEPGRHHVLSSSICDANAVAPFFKAMDEAFGIELAEVTTLHPWLQYQNLLDGTLQSVSNPGHFWKDYALGRSSVGSLIPKETSLVKALEAVLPGIGSRMHAASFRTPTSIVSAADGVFVLDQKVEHADVLAALESYRQRYPDVLSLDERSLVSLDYAAAEYSAVVDLRWLHVNGGKLLKFVLWYDNEWGYASRALAAARHAIPIQSGGSE